MREDGIEEVEMKVHAQSQARDTARFTRDPVPDMSDARVSCAPTTKTYGIIKMEGLAHL
jgi:hypothetical protein